MRIAIIATYVHPTRTVVKEHSVMQSAVPELIASLCPDDAEIELYNEKEREIPLDRDWDLVFFSYLHAYYEHTKVLSALLRARGVTTVAGGRHAGHFVDDCAKYFDAVVVGEPEATVPRLIRDFGARTLQRVYRQEGPAPTSLSLRPYRYDLVDMTTNPFRISGIEASRGCPFHCSFCVLTGWERYRPRPVAEVVDEIRTRMAWNRGLGGLLEDVFVFIDNNLGGSPKFLRALCEALIPLKKYWGCAVTWNVLEDREMVRLMARAGCRYVYTGLEALDADVLAAFDKKQNRLRDVKRVLADAFAEGVVVSIGLILGGDGDTESYLTRIPDLLADISFFAVSYVGIVCPYPETPLFRQLVDEGRLFPDTISRDYDGYTLCHRPKRVDPEALIAHYRRLSSTLPSLGNLARHFARHVFSSSLPRYRMSLAVTTREIATVRHPVANRARTFLAGRDPIEPWDAAQMTRLGLSPQRFDASSSRARRSLAVVGS